MRKSLSDILNGGNGGDNWDFSDVAPDFVPLPPGDYVCRADSGELFTSGRKQTPGYKLVFIAIEGEYSGRKIWHDLWFTPGAKAFTNRDLAKLGITTRDQLESELPPGIVCRVKVVIHRDDDGTERNAVKRFDVLRIDPPQADAFAPVDDGGDDSGDSPTAGTAQAEGGDG